MQRYVLLLLWCPSYCHCKTTLPRWMPKSPPRLGKPAQFLWNSYRLDVWELGFGQSASQIPMVQWDIVPYCSHIPLKYCCQWDIVPYCSHWNGYLEGIPIFYYAPKLSEEGRKWSDALPLTPRTRLRAKVSHNFRQNWLALGGNCLWWLRQLFIIWSSFVLTFSLALTALL